MSKKQVNDLIARLWQTGRYEWDEVHRLVNRAIVANNWRTKKLSSGNACRKRYQRMRWRGSHIVDVPQIGALVKDGAAASDYRVRVPLEVKGNVGFIADTHIPFTHPNYLDFCYRTFRQYDCETIIHIGDVTDQHAISQFDPDPDGYSSGLENNVAIRHLQEWYDVFPNIHVCIGNHDDRPMKKAFKSGLPKRFLKSFSEIWECPPGWQWALSYIIYDNILIEHGITRGIHAAYNRALKTRKSIVMGHTHIMGGVKWIDNGWFAMNVGCGVDTTTYAMSYGKQYNGEITMGCGVLLNEGTLPIFIPMKD